MNIPELIYCADGNPRFAEIAIRHGYTYGAQLPNTVYYWPAFADQAFKKERQFEPYMTALQQYRPRLATVKDWDRAEQFGEIVNWLYEAARWTAEAVIVIPKESGVIPLLPRTVRGRQVRLGYSVPTRFGGTEVPLWEFTGWPVHLLGGSPQRQVEIARYLDVWSADGNYHQNLAVARAQYLSPGRITSAANKQWPQLKETLGHVERDRHYLAFELSCINIPLLWRGLNITIRFAVADDIPAIKAIANQYKDELGFVNRAALLEAVSRRELYVAHDSWGKIVGFCNWHRRRDGWHTIYEIAVHRDYTRAGVGRALLDAVPRPRQLKCTLDNPAMEFYEASGMTLDSVQNGRKRSLARWVAV